MAPRKRKAAAAEPATEQANKLRFQQVLGVTLQLQDILCGVSLAELKPELRSWCEREAEGLRAGKGGSR